MTHASISRVRFGRRAFGKAASFRLGLSMLLLAGCQALPTVTQIAPQRLCVELPNERVDALAWNFDGSVLGVASFDQGSEDGVVRIMRYPTLSDSSVLRRSRAVLSSHGLAQGPSGLTWIEVGVDGFDIVADAGHGSTKVAAVSSALSGLRYQDSTLLAIDDKQREQIVRVDASGLELVTDADGSVEAFDVSPDGRIVYALSHGSGSPQVFVLVDGALSKDLEPTSNLVEGPVFGVDLRDIYFEDHEVGALKSISLVDGSEAVVLDSDVSSVAVSPRGDIAYTFVQPGASDRICIGQPTRVPGA